MQMSCQCLFVHEHCLNCYVDTCYWPVRLLPRSPSFYLYKAPPPSLSFSLQSQTFQHPPSPLSFHIQNLSLPTPPPPLLQSKKPNLPTPLLSPSVYNPPPPSVLSTPVYETQPSPSSLQNPTFQPAPPSSLLHSWVGLIMILQQKSRFSPNQLLFMTVRNFLFIRFVRASL